MLTVGLPFYNSQKTLSNAIKSILIQSYTNWELVLIDDGSTDNSYNIAAQLAATDSRIKLISDGTNRGLISRLNQVIDLAKGEYIARMDADDMMMPLKLERQMKVLLENERIDVIDTAAYTINEKDEPIGMRGTEEIDTWDKKRVLKKVLLFHPTIIAKTSWYKQNKYSEDFVRSEDFELWCRTFDNTVFYRINQPFFLYREGNVNVKNYIQSMKTFRKILRRYGPGVLSKSEFATEILKSYLKSGVYVFFALFKSQYILSSKRNMKLNDGQVSEVNEVIRQIKNLQ
ncbi:MAG: glycosyltransferase family A protein [Ferruginibacter sp.]